ncbi:hypothetical protein F441_23013 [Phytophthora nicotianae CJ01A1]|uniref:RxLR effector protein n=2 Tax=Phytophthora nicotianae TaxID=4792 RepID=W2VN12_PHYNI|nr:hypothetical protein F444_22794 [Phytophthora nicotianae P1976]ETO99570.1 hypothetical protein F441_23013 [Phytophthora nicotianae CJ01A1]
MRTCILVSIAAILYASYNPVVNATASVRHIKSKYSDASSLALRAGDTTNKEQDNGEDRVGGTTIAMWAHNFDRENM